MNFDFSDAAKAKDAGKRLEAGIKDATFEGIEFDTVNSQKTGETYNVLNLKLNIVDYGEYIQKFFEPNSSERTENSWGGLSASSLDHFKIALMQILKAVSPEIAEKIESNELKMTGNFKTIVEFMKTYTNDKIGTKVQIKLLPQRNGFCAMPSFPARVSANGDLENATYIIGHNLTLSSNEVNKINAAKNAKPTDMNANRSNSKTILEDATTSLNDDDLPF